MHGLVIVRMMVPVNGDRVGKRKREVKFRVKEREGNTYALVSHLR
jgi:hypothetical protein